MRGIKYIAAGFVQDAEKLLTEFVKENSAEFSVFTHFWKKHNFAAIWLGRSTTELEQFTHEIYQLTLKFLATSDLFHQIGGVYLLYALFRNQIVEPPTRIRIVLKQYQHFLELRKLSIKERYITLHYVIQYLFQNGFDLVAHPTLVGPRNSKHRMEIEKNQLQMSCILKDLKEHSLCLFENNQLEEIQQLNDSYTELVKTIPFKSNLFQDPNDWNVETHMKNLSKLIGVEKKNSEEVIPIEKAYDNIGARRARIKSNAFASKAWFRQLNHSDDEGEGSEMLTSSTAERKSHSRRAKLQKDSSANEEDEEFHSKVQTTARRRRRIPKEKRRIGRPRKGWDLEQLIIEDDDFSEKKKFRGLRRRGPVARTSYLDHFIQQPFKNPREEITILPSTSEDELDVDNPEAVVAVDDDDKDKLDVHNLEAAVALDDDDKDKLDVHNLEAVVTLDDDDDDKVLTF